MADSVTMPARPYSRYISTSCCWLLAVFIILFPKGGIKIGSAPLTWGYLLLALITPVLTVVRFLALPLHISRKVVFTLLLLFPMQALIVYAFLRFGIANPPYALSNFICLFLLPIAFLLIFAPFFPRLDGVRLSAIIRGCILLAALWGLFLFVWHAVTGSFIEIPYLTVNAQDAGLLEATKHINRGPFYKLISTYNNGNVYGAATMILLPLYDRLEPRRWRRLILKLALLLTLSRTIWFALLLNEALSVAAVLWEQIPTFPVVHFGRFGRRIAIVIVMGFMVFAALLLINSNLAFLFDPAAGGRVAQFAALGNSSLLPEQGLDGFFEVVYVAVLQTLGWLGLFAFILLMLSPLIVLIVDRSALNSPIRRAALKGLLLYAAIALSDGAFDLIPVMTFYWFAFAIYLFGWPGSGKPSLPLSPSPLPQNPLSPASFSAGQLEAGV